MRAVFRQTLAVARRILTEYARQRRALVFWAVFPALMLLLFGSIYRANPAMRMGFDATPSGILIGAALVFFVFPKHDQERKLLQAYHEQDMAAASAE